MQALFAFLSLIAIGFSAHAHGPTPQKAKQSVTIAASADKVWQTVKQFDAIASWHPGVKSSEGDGNNQSGGKRTLVFANGGSIVEELDYYNEAEREYSYRLKTENPAAFPTSSHSVELKVAAGEAPNTSVVTLKSRFYRGDTGNTPPDNLNDAAAVQAMTEFFEQGLNGLKSRVESKQ
ncbi:SRPBCC family protein [Methylomonas rhizoryzae]|uniref:SRPBCC family protein n=1 Tax=Methylomonas rhizoryzae TaxID=2608981 RepID=UPI0012328D84|nr:SRPBCC family protein [Methylomonas rhizoryzae]